MSRAIFDERHVVLATYSRWKLGLTAIPPLTLGILPNMPGFGEGLTRTAFYYKSVPGVIIRWAACSILIAMGLVLLSAAVLFIFVSAKALWVEGDCVVWGRIGSKRVRISNIQSVNIGSPLNAIYLDQGNGAKPDFIPTFAFRSSDSSQVLLSRLDRLINRSG